MNNKKLKKYQCKKNDSIYIIEEDLVGWYLIVCNRKNADTFSKDYLLDTLEDAFFEAEDRFGIAQNEWKEIVTEREQN